MAIINFGTCECCSSSTLPPILSGGCLDPNNPYSAFQCCVCGTCCIQSIPHRFLVEVAFTWENEAIDPNNGCTGLNCNVFNISFITQLNPSAINNGVTPSTISSAAVCNWQSYNFYGDFIGINHPKVQFCTVRDSAGIVTPLVWAVGGSVISSPGTFDPICGFQVNIQIEGLTTVVDSITGASLGNNGCGLVSRCWHDITDAPACNSFDQVCQPPPLECLDCRSISNLFVPVKPLGGGDFSLSLCAGGGAGTQGNTCKVTGGGVLISAV